LASDLGGIDPVAFRDEVGGHAHSRVSVLVRTLLGGRNWWAPAPLRRFHERYGLHEAPSIPAPVTEPAVLQPAGGK